MQNEKEKRKEEALKLLMQKAIDVHLTYGQIADKTGFSKRQIIRWAEQLKEKDMSSILTHGNTGRKPVTTASDQEISYMENFKKTYPVITIAQFRDFYREDVLFSGDPQKRDDVQRFGLKDRSKSWFRQLYMHEGWKSPAEKPVRSDGSREAHPIRAPRDHRGELVQIDGTPYDWFGDGRTYCLHLAVDDAGTEVLAGWFMPTECTRGYAHMTNLIFDKWGIPLAFYSDKDSVFRSVKNGAPSQFARMIMKLDIKMIFANSSQAKGRVERYNGTAQNRLPNDIIRWNHNHPDQPIKDYDTLNDWFNAYYIRYLNAKFSFPVKDPHDAFKELPPDYDPSKIFRGEFSRTVNNNSFSLGNVLYSAFNENGELLKLNQKSKVNVYIDALTGEVYMERYGKHYTCMKIGERKRDPVYVAETEKDIQRYLSELEDSNYKLVRNGKELSKGDKIKKS